MLPIILPPVPGFPRAGAFRVLKAVVQFPHAIDKAPPRYVWAVCPAANIVDGFVGVPFVCVAVWPVWPVAQYAFDRIAPVSKSERIPVVRLAFDGDVTVFGCFARLQRID